VQLAFQINGDHELVAGQLQIEVDQLAVELIPDAVANIDGPMGVRASDVHGRPGIRLRNEARGLVRWRGEATGSEGVGGTKEPVRERIGAARETADETGVVRHGEVEPSEGRDGLEASGELEVETVPRAGIESLTVVEAIEPRTRVVVVQDDDEIAGGAAHDRGAVLESGEKLEERVGSGAEMPGETLDGGSPAGAYAEAIAIAGGPDGKERGVVDVEDEEAAARVEKGESGPAEAGLRACEAARFPIEAAQVERGAKGGTAGEGDGPSEGERGGSCAVEPADLELGESSKQISRSRVRPRLRGAEDGSG